MRIAGAGLISGACRCGGVACAERSRVADPDRGFAPCPRSAPSRVWGGISSLDSSDQVDNDACEQAILLVLRRALNTCCAFHSNFLKRATFSPYSSGVRGRLLPSPPPICASKSGRRSEFPVCGASALRGAPDPLRPAPAFRGGELKPRRTRATPRPRGSSGRAASRAACADAEVMAYRVAAAIG